MADNYYAELISEFQQQSVLVIGDLMLDKFISGNSSRLSPEAPVPVVDVEQINSHCGGAANTALNLHRLGARVSFCSVTGDDAYADEALRLLKATGIETNCIIRDNRRTTLVKTRVIAGQQLLVRYDQGSSLPISADTETKLIRVLEASASTCQSIVIADYDKGILTPRLIRTIVKLKARYQLFVVIDSKRLPVFKSLKPDLIKPNYQEAIAISSRSSYETSAESIPRQAERIAPLIAALTGAGMVAITLDCHGVLLWEQDLGAVHLPARPVQSPQVSGAGDTFIAACSLALLSGASLTSAGLVAGIAASVAISKNGTACCSAEEILNSFIRQEKFLSLGELEKTVMKLRRQGHTIVFTNGCFDILHSGHVRYLSAARRLGDVLIVGLNNDQSIKRLKGLNRPVNKLEDRVQVLSALEAVTYIVDFGAATDDTPTRLIRLIKPDFFVKGGDYSLDQLAEAAAVTENGGQVRILPYLEDHSTSLTIARIASGIASGAKNL